jgi:hypothetical protein
VVLKDVRMFVFFNSLVIILVSLTMHIKVALFLFFFLWSAHIYLVQFVFAFVYVCRVVLCNIVFMCCSSWLLFASVIVHVFIRFMK